MILSKFIHWLSSLRALRLHRSLLAAALFSLFVAGGRASAGEPVTLTIPALDLTANIVTLPLDASLGTWNTTALGDDVGHFEHTPWVGQNGNIVLGGHATNEEGEPSVFYRLSALHSGDVISVQDGAATAYYTVRSIRAVALTDLSVLYPTSAETLTLMTCAGYNEDSETYEQRLVVVAERTG